MSEATTHGQRAYLGNAHDRIKASMQAASQWSLTMMEALTVDDARAARAKAEDAIRDALHAVERAKGAVFQW